MLLLKFLVGKELLCFGDGGQVLLFEKAQDVRRSLFGETPKLASGKPMLKLRAVANDDQSKQFIAHAKGTQEVDHIGYQAKGLLFGDVAAQRKLLQSQVEASRSASGSSS